MLDKASQKHDNTEIMLKGVRALVYNRSHLITQLDKEVVLLNDSVKAIKLVIDSMDVEINMLQDHFTELLYQALKNKHRQESISSILNSKRFAEAYQKYRLMEEMTKYRNAQLKLILDKQRVNRANLQAYLSSLKQRNQLLDDKEREVKKLEKAIAREQKVLEMLDGKKKEIKKELEQKLTQLAQLNSLIQDEIAKGGIESDSNWTTYEQKLYPNLSPYFEKNKGKLPWPSADYIISGHFGSAPHPDFKNITIQNNGVDLLVHPGSTIHAVFDGKITRVIMLPGMGTTLLIKHDRYYTIYANLETIFVNQNDEVSTGDKIGKVPKGEDLQEFHFEIWEGAKKRNPEYWLGL